MTHLTKAICRRAGWDYEQVIVERLLSPQQRQKCLVGYGAYFFAESGFAEFTDALHEAIDRWNGAEAWVNHLTVNSFDGWAVGDALREFVYFAHPIATLHHWTLPNRGLPMVSGHLTCLTGYTVATEQGDALARFMAALPTDSQQEISIYIGALQVTYFQP